MFEIEKESDFGKGLLITLLWFLILIPLALIPFFGIILLVTICPFIAGYMGGKYSNRNIFLGLISGLTWAVIVFSVLYKVIERFAVSGIKIGTAEIFISVLFFSFITLFCGIGSLVSTR